MPLRLQYLDKYRLWKDLVQSKTDRVFVPTEELLGIGEQAAVELALPSLSMHMVIHGSVVGRRRKSLRFAQGVYVRFADSEIEKCRRFLGLEQTPDRPVKGRKSPRIECALPVKFLEPALERTSVAKNISAHGLLVEGPVEVFQSQRVRVMLGLDDGVQLPLTAEVSWADRNVGTLGLRFVELSSEASRKVLQTLQRLTGGETTRSGNETIVVADDDAEILNLFTRALTRSGYQVYQARRGEEALNLVRELKPPLVLLDVLMPGIDGVEICKTMRADAELADIPVIFLSALDAGRLHTVADEAGATDYLTKPVSLGDLDTMVAAYLPREAAKENAG